MPTLNQRYEIINIMNTVLRVGIGKVEFKMNKCCNNTILIEITNSNFYNFR